MKNFKYSSIFIALIVLFVFHSTGFPQNEPLNPNMLDSVFFGEIDYFIDWSSLSGKLKVPVIFVNDPHINGIVVPLLWDGPVNLDSVSFVGSRVEQFTSSTMYYEVDYENHKLQIVVMIFEEPWYIEPGRGLLADMFFDISDSGWAEIDTAAFGPNLLVFIDENCFPRFPEFVKGLFHLIPVTFTPGDANADGRVSVSDVVYLINYVLKNGDPPIPWKAGDVNCDDEVNITDAIYLIDYLFRDGPPPCNLPTGNLLDYFGCKPSQAQTTDTISSDQDCMECQYDGTSILQLQHINAGFNCCPSNLTADIIIEDNFISITEYEHFDDYGPCNCLCLFDVDYQIDNLSPGEYTIKVTELYLEDGDEPLEFTVDLPAFPYSGSYCVTRDHYPWGIQE
jgi:hypothetical protein